MRFALLLLLVVLVVACGHADADPQPTPTTVDHTADELRAEVRRLESELVRSNVDQQDLREQVRRLYVERASRSAPRARSAYAVGAGGVLACIRAIESGGNYGAVSSTGKYRGAYQFDQRTWEANGGHGDPAQAPPAEQDAVAQRTFSSRGLQPWPTPSRRCR